MGNAFSGVTALQTSTVDRQQWFERFANEKVIPLLSEAAENLKKRGYDAVASLHETEGRLVAELQVAPPRLPSGARPPRLTITTSRAPRGVRSISGAMHDHPLLVEFTGTFPGVGATGGFGAEVDYDTIYPSQVEEKIVGFLQLATGA